MLFHRGEYLGVGLLEPQSMYVADADADSVRTRVVDVEAMERDEAPYTTAGKIPRQPVAGNIPY